MKVYELLNSAFRLEPEAFVDTLYRQILNRPAEPDGLRHHVHRLTLGDTRMNVLSGIVGSLEASTLFRKAVAPTSQKSNETVADHVSSWLRLTDDYTFLRTVYAEVLGRQPEEEGSAAWMHAMRSGVERMENVRQILTSF